MNIHLIVRRKSDWKVKIKATLVPGDTMVRLPEYVVPLDTKEKALGGTKDIMI